MSDIQYNLQFEKLCHSLQLGELVNEPAQLVGGFLHRMYAIQTTQGKYAIKALNPQIMLRPAAMNNFIQSEQIVAFLADKIPAHPAKSYRGSTIQQLDNQFYLIFDWVDGQSLKPNEINKTHCKKIGTFLAEIHKTDFSDLGIINEWSYNDQLTDWNDYLQKGKENNCDWVNLLFDHIDKLYEWNTKANESAKRLASDMVISHRDLDPKNILWNQDNPILIDWESAGYINPMQDMTETAIYWSEEEGGNIDKERFLALIAGYTKRYGNVQANWRMVLNNGFLGKLGWLEYSLKRSLWIECTDEEEQKMGTEQVTGTINAIRRYADMISELEEWLVMLDYD